MKIAFLIAAHAHPALLARLVRRLQAPCASVHLHLDAAVEARPFRRALEGDALSCVHWAPRVRSPWGTFGQVRASLSLLRSALARDPEAEMFLLLSGQDYPVRRPEQMAEFFEERRGVSFIECAPLPWEKWSPAGGLDRLRHYHFFFGRQRLEYPSDPLPGSRKLRVAHAACRLLLPRTRRLPEGIAFHGGANWWNLTREAAQAILGYDRAHPALRRACQHSLSSDEIFFQTALMNSGGCPVELASLRWLFWDEARGELPGYLRPEHFEVIRDSGALFARKVHPERSSELLDRIDRELFAAPPSSGESAHERI